MVQISGIENIQIPSLTLDIVDESGNIITAELTLTKVGLTSTFKTNFIPPTAAFKILLRGR